MKRLISFLICVLLLPVVVAVGFFWMSDFGQSGSSVEEPVAAVESSEPAVNGTVAENAAAVPGLPEAKAAEGTETAKTAETTEMSADELAGSPLPAMTPASEPALPEMLDDSVLEDVAAGQPLPTEQGLLTEQELNDGVEAMLAEMPEAENAPAAVENAVPAENATPVESAAPAETPAVENVAKAEEPAPAENAAPAENVAPAEETPAVAETAKAEEPAPTEETAKAEPAPEPAVTAPVADVPAETASAEPTAEPAEAAAENHPAETAEVAEPAKAAEVAETTKTAEAPATETTETPEAGNSDEMTAGEAAIVAALDEVESSLNASATEPEVAEPAKAVGAESKPFDPIAENGEIFKDWPTPKLTLVLTGRLNGYMEPCGCAGMERMMGGLSRRATFFEQLEDKGWNPVYFDTGGVSPGFTKQAHMKFLSAVNMLREMGYDTITLGQIDLNFPAGDLLSEVSNPGRSGKLFTSANVGIFTMDSKTLPPAKVIVQNGVKVGVVGILGDAEQKEVRNDEIQFAEVQKSLDRIIPALKQKADFIVLLAHTSVAEARDLAKHYPDVDVVVCSDGPPVPPKQVEVIPETGQYFVQIGEKGMHVAVLGLYEDDETPVRYQLVPMDSRFEASQKIRDLMGLYQDQLAVAGLEGLGIRTLRNPYAESHGAYIGSQRCESCHAEAYEKWTSSRHAKAWTSLENSIPPRTSDPECIVCHVVGWDVKMKAPYEGGFLNPKDTPSLKRVGCESCHGPGEKHVTAELGKDTAEQEKYRKAVRVTLEDSKKTHCVMCHDLDNSPAFDFDTYWKKVEHKTEEE